MKLRLTLIASTIFFIALSTFADSTPRSMQASATLNSSSCITSAPTLYLTPPTQTGNPGQTLKYIFSIFNNDTNLCASSEFDITTNQPTGWTGTASTTSLTISPQASASAWLYFTSGISTSAGDYTVKGITTRAISSGIETSSAQAIYTVVTPTPTPTPTPRFCRPLTCPNGGTQQLTNGKCSCPPVNPIE